MGGPSFLVLRNRSRWQREITCHESHVHDRRATHRLRLTLPQLSCPFLSVLACQSSRIHFGRFPFAWDIVSVLDMLLHITEMQPIWNEKGPIELVHTFWQFATILRRRSKIWAKNFFSDPLGWRWYEFGLVYLYDEKRQKFAAHAESSWWDESKIPCALHAASAGLGIRPRLSR